MPDLSQYFPVILATHITLAIALFVPSLLLPFTLRNRLVNQGYDAPDPGAFVRVLLWIQAHGTLVIGVGLALTGIAMLVVLGPGMLQQPWLLVSLATYAATAIIAFGVQRPSLRRLVRRDGIESDADREAWRARARRQRYIAYAITTAVGLHRVHDVDQAGALVTAPATARPRTAAIVNLGCKVNQSEMEAAARLLREASVPLVDPDRAADLVLVNTCTVTATADEKSRAAVRRARRANPDAEIVVTGCSVQVGPEAFEAVDAAARLVGNEDKAAFLAELEALLRLPGDVDGGGAPHGPIDAALPTLSGVEAVVAAPLDGVSDDRASVERTRAFVKVQDGCSFYCTYCIIPKARGAERSLEPGTVLADVRRALAAGHREIVLTGINIGTYDGGRSERGARGSHVRSAMTLAGLVRLLLAETPVERIRLSSIEPQHMDDELLATWVDGGPRTLPHLHLPLQSGDDGVLRRMGRRYRSADYAGVVERARAAIPGVAIHADVIAGFPTEDDAAHERSLAFIRSLDPAGLHVFRYSARPGTPATRMDGQVDERTKKQRAADLLALASEAKAAFARRSVGTETRVLLEQRLPDGRWVGHAEDHVLVAVRGRSGRPLGPGERRRDGAADGRGRRGGGACPRGDSRPRPRFVERCGRLSQSPWIARRSTQGPQTTVGAPREPGDPFRLPVGTAPVPISPCGRRLERRGIPGGARTDDCRGGRVRCVHVR